MPPDAWEGRHRGFVIFLWFEVVGLAIFGVVRGFDVFHALGEAGIVALAALAASAPRTSRRFRAIAATLGLITSSAILVHLSGGTIEAHFHFFVMVTLITLYQEWVPFLLAIGYVVVHHAVMGTVDPGSVYNHPAAIQNPFKWAVIHGAFVLGASIAGLIVWKRNEDLREREQLQAELNLSLDAFSSRVAHDLRNPLAAIRGAAGTALILSEEDDDTQKLLRIIDRHANRAAGLVSALLDLARARGRPRLESIPIGPLVRDLTDDFNQLDVEVGPLPDSLIVDSAALRQALSNLLANAQRYAAGDDGRAHVWISGEESHAGWTIVVADDGPGVPAEEAAGIFDALTRGSNAKGDGAGLGLSIVSAVAESHGGRAEYRSRQGGGSEFHLFFPRASAQADDGLQAVEATPA